MPHRRSPPAQCHLSGQWLQVPVLCRVQFWVGKGQLGTLEAPQARALWVNRPSRRPYGERGSGGGVRQRQCCYNSFSP